MSERSMFKVRQQAIVLNDENKALLLKYGEKSKESGKWDLIGGHLEEGESWEDGLRREIKEEAGIVISSLKPIRIFNHKKSYICFFVARSNSSVVRLSEEHTAYRWVKIDELDDLNLVRDNIKEDIILALQNQ